MKREISPQLLAGRLGAPKSGNKTITNSNEKNNAPDFPLLSETDRESMGRRYMSLAVQCGRVELQEGLSLYSAAGMNAMGAKTMTGEVVVWDNDFYFMAGKYIFECTDPLHVLDCMESEKEKTACGYVLPISFEAAKAKWGDL
jgi:hypothetical protein